jgi:hypothetical protein
MMVFWRFLISIDGYAIPFTAGGRAWREFDSITSSWNFLKPMTWNYFNMMLKKITHHGRVHLPACRAVLVVHLVVDINTRPPLYINYTVYTVFTQNEVSRSCSLVLGTTFLVLWCGSIHHHGAHHSIIRPPLAFNVGITSASFQFAARQYYYNYYYYNDYY